MITKEQALTANEFHFEGYCHRTKGPRGAINQHSRVYRRNGKTQTWKTRPDEFRVPIKFGLREHWAVHQFNAINFHVPEDCPLNDPDWLG